MTRTVFIVVLASLSFRFVSAQYPDETAIQLIWPDQQMLKINDLLCEGCYQDAGVNNIPHYQRTFLCDNSVNALNVSILNYTTLTLPLAALPESQRRGIPDDFYPACRVTRGGEQAYAVVEMIPMRLAAGGMEVELLATATLQFSPGVDARGKNRGASFAEHSMLATGTWYKIGTGKDGIYKIDKSLLQSLGVDVSTVNPQQINVYGNGGELLPILNNEPRVDDLRATPVLFSGNEADGQFDDADFMLFYGKGSDTWDLPETGDPWTHTKHFYSDSAFYFLRIDDALPVRISNGGTTDPETHLVTTFQDYAYHENDLKNLVKSGREF
ncbi:MAG: hypothetical protein JNM00_06825, partial [Flavobacteriales bacterium]|nr:hypothetical protein [Flavobacteriales bacterium]